MYTVLQSCTSQPELCVSWWGGGLGAREWGLPSGPREGTAVGEETGWGNRRETAPQPAGKVSRGGPGHCGSKVPLLIGTQRGMVAIARHSHTWVQPLWAMGAAHACAGSPTPQARVSLFCSGPSETACIPGLFLTPAKASGSHGSWAWTPQLLLYPHRSYWTRALLPSKPLWAAWVLVIWMLHVFKASSSCAGLCGHACGNLYPASLQGQGH